MHELGVRRVVRTVFAAATIGSALIGFAIRGDPRWFVASGAFGFIWLVWDLLSDHVLAPLGDWIHRMWAGGVGTLGSGALRPTLDDTIRLLESHLEKGASRPVQIQAAIRLEEIYRTIRKDPDAARRVIGLVKERFPEASSLFTNP